jgi:hypothetical protein
MNCSPNRGSTGNKLMLINHWIAYSPPDPGRAGTDVNSTAVLNRRIEQCINDRGVLPTVLAVDFAERGNLVKVVADYNHQIKRALAELKGSGRRPSDATTTSLDASSPGLPEASANAAPYQAPTVITSLTGGDPTRFCADIGPFVRTMAGWSLADLSKPSAAAGLPALTFGPLVARQIQGLAPSTPEELLNQFSAASAQADTAVDALRQAGLTQADIDALADTASQQLEGTNPDSALVEQLLDYLDD